MRVVITSVSFFYVHILHLLLSDAQTKRDSFTLEITFQNSNYEKRKKAKVVENIRVFRVFCSRIFICENPFQSVEFEC